MKLKATCEKQKEIFWKIRNLAKSNNDEITEREALKAYQVLNWVIESRNEDYLLESYEEYEDWYKRLNKEKEGA
ncbi:MAG: hypothetical protein E7479_04385 [Ruminococcaceae bacterium]|nr:hypothetical protein [Oscillospiraceae bacterium]